MIKTTDKNFVHEFKMDLGDFIFSCQYIDNDGAGTEQMFTNQRIYIGTGSDTIKLDLYGGVWTAEDLRNLANALDYNEQIAKNKLEERYHEKRPKIMSYEVSDVYADVYLALEDFGYRLYDGDAPPMMISNCGSKEEAVKRGCDIMAGTTGREWAEVCWQKMGTMEICRLLPVS